MSTQVVKSAYPGCGADEMAGILQVTLREHGLRVIERVDHDDAPPFARVRDHLVRHPWARAFTLYEATQGACASTPIAILDETLHERGRWAHWFTGALSRRTGGWAVGVEVCRTRNESGLGVFYAGHALESATPPDEDAAWSAFQSHYRTLTGAHPDSSRWSPRSRPRTWIVERARRRRGDGPRVHRAVIAGVDRPRTRAALAAHAVALHDRVTPIAEAPYVVVDGPLDEPSVAALARSLDTTVVAVTIDGAEVTWIEADRHAVRVGAGRGAAVLVDVWARWAAALGETPAIVRWPAPHGPPPGAFEYLARAGLVDERTLAPLQAVLAPQQYVLTAGRGGERFDSIRWSVMHDARLARLAATSLPDPDRAIATLLEQLESACDDLEASSAIATRLAPGGDDVLYHLAAAYRAAVYGLNAYHAHRELPGDAAAPAARVIERALADGTLSTDDLLDAAIELARPEPRDAPGWFWGLVEHARGDSEQLRGELARLERERLVRVYAHARDLATRLVRPPYAAWMAPTLSDAERVEFGVWVVAQGRACYRAVARNPSAVPARRPDARAADVLELAAEVYRQRFRDELPTDVVVE